MNSSALNPPDEHDPLSPSVPWADSERKRDPSAFVEVLTEVVTWWSWRHCMNRANYWCAVGQIFIASAIFYMSLFFLPRAARGPLALLLLIFGLTLIIKCDIWRYRDAGFSAWWLVLQIALFIASFIAFFIGLVGLLITSLFDSNASSPGLTILFVLSLPTMAATSIWMFVWCLMPSRQRRG